jgi:nascent polypeptide-associated complex subunit beta
METNPDILAARAKLFGKGFDSRTGGKGTQRRKQPAKKQGTAAASLSDDKKLSTQYKKMGLNQIAGIEEVNMFTDKNEVIHFKDPKVHGSLQSNTYAISGPCEKKGLQEMLPKVISQLGSENLMSLRKVMEQASAAGAGAGDIPDMDTNFEEVSKGAADVEVD